MRVSGMLAVMVGAVLTAGTGIGTAAGTAAMGAVGAPAAPAPPAAVADPTIVVASNGDDAGPGTLQQPLRTVQRGVDRARPGDVIAVRAGTYVLDGDNITITTSGEPGRPITLGAYRDERVVIDGERLPAGHTPVGGSIPRAERGAIHQEASYWRVSGLEIVNGPYGYYCDGCNHNVFSGLVTHDNYESGFQLQGGSGDNLILNLDSYANRDPRKNGESADGLAIKEGSGTGNTVRGARLWNNVDDGFDAWKFTSPLVIEDTVAYGNGYDRWNFPDFAGDGNGFKLGGGTPAPAAAHTVRNSVAYGNAAHGITDNGNPGALVISRNTTFRNEGTGFDADTSGSAAVFTGNLSVLDRKAVSLGGGAAATGNSWNLGGTWNGASVLSTDPASLTGPRAADGALPSSRSFLVPRDGTAVGARL
ncbi:right-handed parallel beta-helix repeat-containing protein [Streptomyces sp. NPDC088400]|uniref:right-handed parallel beta-helix repeat-containing protein n=1 Tax=Streptomyces sp. NPDC088400 TaxID=3365861 RepID=UPI00381552ED